MNRVSCGFEDGPEGLGRELLIEIGPTLKVDIGFDPEFDPEKPTAGPHLPLKDVSALIDTGAAISCIDAGLAMRLQLPLIDQSEVSGVSGPMPVNMHIAHIHVPSLRFTLFGQFAGVYLAAGGQRHDVLIGRDFLRHFHLTYDGPTGAVAIVDHTAPMDIEPWPDE